MRPVWSEPDVTHRKAARDDDPFPAVGLHAARAVEKEYHENAR